MKKKIEKISDYCKSFINDNGFNDTDVKVSFDGDVMSVSLFDTETKDDLFSFQVNFYSVEINGFCTDRRLFDLTVAVWTMFNWDK